MTHPEDLRPGQYVALVGCKRDQQVVTKRGGLWIEACDVKFDGMPLKIVSISLPFICVDHPDGDRIGLDIRDWDFKRLSRHYARSMLAAPTYATQLVKTNAPGPGHCQRCGSKLIQRRVGDGQWATICPECDGQKPPARKVIVQ